MLSPKNLPYWNICRRVYLVWALVIFVGFIATQFHQLPDINYLWLFLSLIGLGYMALQLKQIKFKNLQLLYIGLLWLLTIAFGMAVSILCFVYEPLGEVSAYLGIFWLLLMGIAHLFNGMVDRNRTYFLTGGVQIIAGAIGFMFEPLQTMQYLAAGIIGAGAMVWLILSR
jgi:hypothetical protein